MHIQLTVQVPRTSELDQMLAGLTAKLERRLWLYQPGLVRLHGRLVHHDHEGTVCTLDLHLPSGPMCAEATAGTAQAALTAASEELFEQLNRQRKKLTEQRRRRARNAPPAPEAAGNGHASPAALADLSLAADPADPAEALSQQLPGLREFIARRLLSFETGGDGGAEPRLDPREVLDEVVVEALGGADPEPGSDPQRWLRLLAERAIRRLARDADSGPDAPAMPSLDDGAGAALDDDEPGGLPLTARVGNGEATPEQIATTAELVTQLAAATRGLGREQRHDLLLWLFEGFTARELAAVSRRSRRDVEASLAAARKHVGAAADLPAELRRRLA